MEELPRKSHGWGFYLGWTLFVAIEAAGLLTFVIWKLYH
jgi:hypothetical protein